ncbi:MAG: TonB family protein [Prolixibacteraceae bacterium]
MNTLGSYLLQMSCWMAAFWVLYVLVLKKETYFGLNRWFLNAGLVVSLLMPLFPFTYKVYRNSKPLTATLMQVTQGSVAESQSSVDYWLLVYLAGALYFVVRFVVQHLNLYRIRKRSASVSIDSVKIFRIEKETAPFSFFNQIYVSSSLSNDLELNTVVAHEKVHIHERHWADLLLLEVVRTLQWFNPLLQLYRKAMMQNHEYLADSGTLEHGVSERTYRAVLANQMLGIPVVSFANSFTFINSGKRLLMMKKDKSTPVKRLKLLLILPLMAAIVMGFSKPKYVFNDSQSTLSTQSSETTKGKVYNQYGKLMEGVVVSSISNGTSAISNEQGEFELNSISDKDDISAEKNGYIHASTLAGENGLAVLMGGHGTETKANEPIKIKGKVIDESGEALPGASIIVSNTSYGTVSNRQGEFILDAVKPTDNIVVSFVGYETKVSPAKEEMTFKMERNVVSIEVRKEKMAPPPPPPPTSGITIKSKDGKEPLIVIDGEIKKVDLNQMDPNSIEKVEALKDEAATKLYGDKGKNGVILITTKNSKIAPPPPAPSNSLEFRSKEGKTPLIVIDGKISKDDINEIDPNAIQSINVLKDQSAIDKYGVKAKDGVIEISMKKEEARISPEGETFIIVEDMPQYPGGKEALDQYIRDAASKFGLTGKAFVTFTINAKGEVQDAKVVGSTPDQLKAPALKIVKEMQKWKPGMQRGKPVKVSYTVVIEF